MPTTTYRPWPARLGSFGLWLLLGASLVYWGLRLSQGVADGAAPVAPPAGIAWDAQAMARGLGAQPGGAAQPLETGAVASGDVVLVGILAGRATGGGAALLRVADAPARPYRVGATVREGLVVQSLTSRTVRLGDQMGGPARLTLEMPPS